MLVVVWLSDSGNRTLCGVPKVVVEICWFGLCGPVTLMVSQILPQFLLVILLKVLLLATKNDRKPHELRSERLQLPTLL